MSKTTTQYNSMKNYLKDNGGYGGVDVVDSTLHDKMAALLAIATALNRIADGIDKLVKKSAA